MTGTHVYKCACVYNVLVVVGECQCVWVDAQASQLSNLWTKGESKNNNNNNSISLALVHTEMIHTDKLNITPGIYIFLANSTEQFMYEIVYNYLFYSNFVCHCRFGSETTDSNVLVNCMVRMHSHSFSFSFVCSPFRFRISSSVLFSHQHYNCWLISLSFCFSVIYPHVYFFMSLPLNSLYL